MSVLKLFISNVLYSFEESFNFFYSDQLLCSILKQMEREGVTSDNSMPHELISAKDVAVTVQSTNKLPPFDSKKRRKSCCTYDLIKCDSSQARFEKQPTIDTDELQLKLDLHPTFLHSKSHEIKKLQRILTRSENRTSKAQKHHDNDSAPVLSNHMKQLFMSTFKSTISKRSQEAKQDTYDSEPNSTASSSIKSILKDTQSARSYSSQRKRHGKKVQFRDNLTAQRALSQWFWKNAPHQKQRPVTSSSHTVRGSEFNVNIHDPHDFGPHFRASTGYFSDHMDPDSSSSHSEYCNGNCECIIL